MALKKQIIIAATVFWMCVLSVNLLRPHVSYNNTLRYKYLSDKVEWENRFDMVIAGDSRVLIGISPRAMQSELPGYEIGNLGFIALVYSEDYLNYVRNTLHTPVKNRVIVISFSPRSLLPQESGDCYFRKWNEESRIPMRFELDKGTRWLQVLFHELSEEDLNERFRKEDSKYMMVSFDSGWMATRHYPERLGAAKGQYKSLFRTNKIDSKLLDAICARTKKWTEEGIKVFGIRMPISPKIFVIEKTMSGFETEEIRNKFELSGGIWLDPPVNNLTPYDGSHLRYDSAAVYSKRLARELKKHLVKNNE